MFFQVISLYHLGYDLVAENIIGLIEEPDVVLPPLIAITTQRFKRNLEHSTNQPEWIVSLPPQLFKRIRMAVCDLFQALVLSILINYLFRHNCSQFPQFLTRNFNVFSRTITITTIEIMLLT